MHYINHVYVSRGAEQGRLRISKDEHDVFKKTLRTVHYVNQVYGSPWVDPPVDTEPPVDTHLPVRARGEQGRVYLSQDVHDVFNMCLTGKLHLIEIYRGELGDNCQLHGTGPQVDIDPPVRTCGEQGRPRMPKDAHGVLKKTPGILQSINHVYVSRGAEQGRLRISQDEHDVFKMILGTVLYVLKVYGSRWAKLSGL